MKTDELIAMLGTNVEPVDRRQIARTFNAAMAVGVAIALSLMFATLGVRVDLTTADAAAFVAVKLVFTIGTVALTSFYLVKLARPGGVRKTSIVYVALPFVAIVALAAFSLFFSPRSHWNQMIVGDQWLECLLSIPVIAIVPFAVIVWALRKTAPTDLVRTGALAGIAAGGVSATAYALHCTDDSLPFIALWYGGTIALCTIAGALLGPRLLRW